MIVMISVLLSGLLSGIVSLAVAVVTLRGSIKRDHEADWRKMKLDLYREFVFAAAGLVPTRSTKTSQERYLDAANVLMLVGSKDVVKALQEFQSNNLNNKYLKPLFLAMRHDVMPQKIDEADLEFRFVEFGNREGSQIFPRQPHPVGNPPETEHSKN